jgi:hypothetical protein
MVHDAACTRHHVLHTSPCFAHLFCPAEARVKGGLPGGPTAQPAAGGGSNMPKGPKTGGAAGEVTFHAEPVTGPLMISSAAHVRGCAGRLGGQLSRSQSCNT